MVARQAGSSDGGTPGRAGMVRGRAGWMDGLVRDFGRRRHLASTPMDFDRPDLDSDELCRPTAGPRQRRTLQTVCLTNVFSTRFW